ncbi:hypothetical protein WMF31_20830 [Sorangium sp. So ce1036]|uniref:hypothetical protein n=1 Tax=Sorangium sp. So ce1036 TaxID=3133328 RepID=UPI003F042622
MGRIGSSTAKGRGVVQGLSGLLGLGLCLGISSASAGGAPQAISPRRAPQARAVTQQAAAQQAATAYVANRAKRRMTIAGTATLGGFWAASAASAALLALDRPQIVRQAHCTKIACFLLPRRERRAANPATLLIPVAGPWIHLSTSRPSAASAVKLSILGAGQAVGLGMLLGGIAMPAQVRVPVRRGQVIQVGAVPLVGPDGVGIAIQGSM